MTYENPIDVPAVLREAICWHEVFRKLGVHPDDLFILVSPPNLAVVVRQGDRMRGVIAGPLGDLDEAAVTEKWPAVVRLWNRTCNSEAEIWAFEESKARRDAIRMMFDFASDGFYFGGGRLMESAS